MTWSLEVWGAVRVVCIHWLLKPTTHMSRFTLLHPMWVHATDWQAIHCTQPKAPTSATIVFKVAALLTWYNILESASHDYSTVYASMSSVEFAVYLIMTRTLLNSDTYIQTVGGWLEWYSINTSSYSYLYTAAYIRPDGYRCVRLYQ